ncbi:AAA family ATPase [Bacillus cereus group sp. MYBK30-1]|uniref:AAA family ATPase n=1 Tax=unclassified Bacillus cereus group TaxID=2750818 RepID=UPI003F7B3128
MSDNNKERCIKVSVNFEEFKRLKVFSNQNNTNTDYSGSIVSQLSQDIHNSNPAPYLLSGYRGVGKTTLIKKVEKELKNLSVNENKTRIFVYVSIPKYQDITLILRKISRALYKAILEYEEKHTNFQFDEKIKSKVEMLYMKTFYEITDSYKIINKLENQVTLSSELNLKKFLNSIIPPVVVFLVSLSSLNISMNFGMVSSVISAIWLVLEAKTSYKYSNSRQKEKEDVIKRLYDNEIAEVELIEVLKEISNDISVVLVLDEIDKIEKDDEVSTLVNELKPLMLSEYVYTVLVTGQNLFYQYHLANSKDNAVISSLFSKVVHVPILDINIFEKMIDGIFENVEKKNRDLTKYYLKNKIFEANRIPRRFFSLIQQDIEWDNNKAYININPEQSYYLKWNSEVFDIITNIEDELKDEYEYSQGIVDFLLNQLYNWVKKIISSGTGFTKETILMNSVEDSHPLKEFKALEDYLDSLLNKMLESNKIIKVESSEEEIKYQIKYNRELLKGMKGKSTSLENEHNINYLNKVYSFIEMINKIYTNLFEGSYLDGNISSVDENISIEYKLIRIIYLNNEDVLLNQNYDVNILGNDSLIQDMLSLIDGKLESDINQGLKNNLGRLNQYKSTLLEEYVFYLVGKSFSNEFKVNFGNHYFKKNSAYTSVNNSDIIASSSESTYLFEIKLARNKKTARLMLKNSLRDVDKILEQHSIDTNHVTLSILIFIEDDILDEKEEIQILRSFKEQLKQYENCLKVKLITDFSAKQINGILEELLDENKEIQNMLGYK